MPDPGHHHRRQLIPLERVVIVGASLAGVRAGETLRREGYAGELIVVGAERHFPPYDRPPLSKQVLAGKWDLEKARLRVDDGLDPTLLLGRRATSLDIDARTIALDDGQTIAFDGLVIATGASPRTLPGFTPDDDVLLLRNVEDCLALRARIEAEPKPRVTVIGAGFIGCEVAATCREAGCEVTMIEALELPLVRVLGPEMGAVAAALHRAHGVDLRLGVTASREELDADVIVVGIGVTPNTEWLESSGLAIDNGVVCGPGLEVVGVEGMVAAGDIARWPNELFGEVMRVEHWTNAAEQGEHAALTLLRGADQAGPFTPIPYFWSDQFGTKFQFVGTTHPGDEVRIAEGSVDEGKFVAAYVREGRAVGALCVNRPNRTIAWRNLIAERTML